MKSRVLIFKVPFGDQSPYAVGEFVVPLTAGLKLQGLCQNERLVLETVVKIIQTLCAPACDQVIGALRIQASMW